MPIKIDITSIGGEPNTVEIGDASPEDETLALALESENGIVLEYETKKEAEASRFRFYRRIRRHREKGFKSYNSIMIRVENNTLVLTRLPVPNIKVL